jgi:hypothetical protein
MIISHVQIHQADRSGFVLPRRMLRIYGTTPIIFNIAELMPRIAKVLTFTFKL